MKQIFMTVAVCSSVIALVLAFSSPGFSSMSPVLPGSRANSGETVLDAAMPASPNLNGAVAGQYDVLSILEQELGHALAIAFQPNLDYNSAVSAVPGNAYAMGSYPSGTFNAGDLSHVTIQGDLTHPYLWSGARMAASYYENASNLSLAYVYAVKPAALPPALLLFVPGLAVLLAARRKLNRE